MDSFFEDENCIYIENHTILFTTTTNKTHENYTIKIYSEHATDSNIIRITISSAKDNTLSYTSIITPSTYQNMQKAQELHISYENFAEELKSLLSKCKTTDIIIKFTDMGSDLELGFYTMTSIKEIKLLSVAFMRTPLNELVQYFKQKADFHASRYVALELQLKNNKHDQQLVISEHKKEMENLQEYYKNENKYLKNAFDSYKLDLNYKVKSVNIETEQLKNKICVLNEERKKYAVEVARRDDMIKELQQNITELKSAFKFIAIKNQQQMVTLEKYDKVKKLFSSTLADLLKYQMCLKKVQNLSELQKAENGRLREDIKSCVNYITTVCHDDNVLKQVILDNKTVLETIGELDDQIAQFHLSS